MVTWLPLPKLAPLTVIVVESTIVVINLSKVAAPLTYIPTERRAVENPVRVRLADPLTLVAVITY